MKNAVEDLVDLEELINGFKGSKAKNIARLLLKEESELRDYLTNFSKKGFNDFDDLLTYRSYRIEKEMATLSSFESDFLTYGLCEAVLNCFYQYFEKEEADVLNNLFSESTLTLSQVFHGIRDNHDLSLYKFIL